jgi:tight adherence protein B
VLAAVIMMTTPDYLPMLLNDPAGKKLAVAAFVGMLAGILWIRRIIRIQV